MNTHLSSARLVSARGFSPGRAPPADSTSSGSGAARGGEPRPRHDWRRGPRPSCPSPALWLLACARLVVAWSPLVESSAVECSRRTEEASSQWSTDTSEPTPATDQRTHTDGRTTEDRRPTHRTLTCAERVSKQPAHAQSVRVNLTGSHTLATEPERKGLEAWQQAHSMHLKSNNVHTNSQSDWRSSRCSSSGHQIW